MRKLLVMFAIGVLFVAALACNGAAARSANSDLQRLVERLVGGPLVTESPELLPGHLPPNFDLPIPEGSEVLGSVVIPTENGGTTHVVLDVPGEPDDVFSSLTHALARRGWRDESRGITDSGFVSSRFGPPSSALFCSETESASLNVSAFPLRDGLTDLRFILLNNVGQSHCDLEPPTRVESSRGETPLPTLTAPPAVQQSGVGSGGGISSNGVRNFHTEADLVGSISVEQAEAHYREQLTEAGWTLIDNNTAGPSAWSTWRFADDSETVWGAMLLVTKIPEAEDSLFVYLRASH